MDNQISVMLVDDQQLMLDGLRLLLDMEDDIEVVAECQNGADAVAMYGELRPDVVLMDIRMPVMDGVEATRRLCQRWPEARIIVLTTFDDDQYIFEGVRAGAAGYLLKAISGAELAAAVRTIAAGGGMMEPSVARRLMAQFSSIATITPSTTGGLVEPLSEREQEILELVAQGHNNREIARQLHLAEGTVKNYLSNVLQKLNVRDRTQAALRARELGLL